MLWMILLSECQSSQNGAWSFRGLKLSRGTTKETWQHDLPSSTNFSYFNLLNHFPFPIPIQTPSLPFYWIMIYLRRINLIHLQLTVSWQLVGVELTVVIIFKWPKIAIFRCWKQRTQNYNLLPKTFFAK